MSGIGLKNQMLEAARRAAAAIALLFAANGGFALAQGAPPLPCNTPVPKTISVVLRPIAGNLDAGIVRAYAARNHQKIIERFGPPRDYDIETALVGRGKIAPGPEPQILILLTQPDDCERGPCKGFAITKSGDDWVELISLYGHVDGAIGFVDLATESIPARLLNPATYDYDIAAIIEPENQGRQTVVWNEEGYFWNGTRWRVFCWRRCD